MAQDQAPIATTTVASLTELSGPQVAAWDACAGTTNPFVRHAFLAQLERTGCVGPRRGWTPCHQLLWRGDELVAAVPLYLKTDSYGEFIFDWAWAAAAEQHGIGYYPKLVSAVPYTPATGPRILRAPGVTLADVVAPLCAALGQLTLQTGASGVHFLFAQADEVEALEAHGFVPRQSSQYHFDRDAAWHCFDDFTAAMRAPSRKQVRRERARAREHGLDITFRPARELPAEDLQALHTFYRQTVWEKGAHAYLTAAFFAQLPSLPHESSYVAMAHRDGRAIAGALYFRGGSNLYGRYWGAIEQLDALHFELCYYLPIAWGLEHGIDHFEAGAQGEHKIKRGLLPAPCYSAHLLRHPALARGVREFCAEEAKAVQAQRVALADHGPFPRQAR